MDSKPTTEPQSVEAYLKLLLAFGRLPETKRSPTFMEVSGYPHYENVCSNILKFFFDPAAEHGLGDLLVVAFLRMAGVVETPNTHNIRVLTRQSTDAGNSIDLIIDSEAFTIGIENKIFHWLANDLEDYGGHIDRLGTEKPIVIKAVLGLHLINSKSPLKGGFVSYSYGQFWQQVRQLLGHYLSKADPKWVSYLLDLIATTTNLAGQNMELQKTDQFFIEHNEVLEKMIAERKAFLARLNQKVTTLCTMMGESEAVAALSRPPWVYEDSCLVLDFSLANAFPISFDLYLKPAGWELQLFGRNKKSAGYLLTLMGEPALRTQCKAAPLGGDRHIVQTWPLHSDLGEIKDALCSWVGAVATASKSASK
jgi:hypothetical protein